MSRVGKKPIEIISGVTATINGQQVEVKGPKGSLKMELHPVVKVELQDSNLIVSVPKPEDKNQRALWGLTRALLNNMVVGVTQGFKKQLEINGIGFKAAIQGNSLLLNVGFSHPVNYPFPEGIKISVEKNVITIEGIDRHLVGQSAAEIREIKKPEPYKGKGIKYADETIRRKAGKVVKSSG